MEPKTPHPNPHPQVRDRAARRSLDQSSIAYAAPYARRVGLLGLAVVLCFSAVGPALFPGKGAAGPVAGSSVARAASVCRLDGSGVRVIELKRSKVPAVVAHIEESWREGFPARVFRVHRAGSEQRRDRATDAYEARYPQPVGDGRDLDEQPAAVLRRSWRAHVRPVPEKQNRSAGGSLGAGLRGCAEGTRVRWRFVP